jgi:hypothetical protein
LQTIIIQRGGKRLLADIFNTVIEPLDANNRQVVYFCRDKSGNKYRVPKSEVVARCVSQSENKPKEKKRKRCCA